MSKNKHRARSDIRQEPDHIPGWPREHYTADHTEKRAYRTLREALHIRNRLVKQGETGIEAYYCSHCHQYHTGHASILTQRQYQLLTDMRVQQFVLRVEELKAELNRTANHVLHLKNEIERLQENIFYSLTKPIDTL